MWFAGAEGHFLMALDFYTQALDICRDLKDEAYDNAVAVLLCKCFCPCKLACCSGRSRRSLADVICALFAANRAACHLKIENFGSAIADATEAIKTVSST